MNINPFSNLYLAESVPAQEFATIFSPFLLPFVTNLYQGGNVILRGTQGSGKTMLLNVLKPDVQIALGKKGVGDLPGAAKFFHYASAGINLARSNALDFAQRPILRGSDVDVETTALLFGDFLNYWLVRDLFQSVRALSVSGSPIEALVNLSDERSGEFTRRLASCDCWFGYLSGVTNFDDLVKRISERIYAYRAYHQGNAALGLDVINSKTAIGTAISETVSAMYEFELLSSEVPVLMRIDEYEQMSESPNVGGGLSSAFEAVVNRALYNRDPLVSYKIGTRPYGWRSDPRVLSRDRNLENERNYVIIDIEDAILRRKEHSQRSLYNRFAEDVFDRRLKFHGVQSPRSPALKAMLGESPSASAIAEHYAAKTSFEVAVAPDADWPQAWVDYLRSLYERDKIDAMLAAAWLRQRGGAKRKAPRYAAPPPLDGGVLPWRKLTWRKERLRMASFQLASNARQRPMWAGSADVLSLTSGSILHFISVCKFIWDAFNRWDASSSSKGKRGSGTAIPANVQASAIHLASESWINNIKAGPNGANRYRFIVNLGNRIARQFLADRPMSYPGAVGFSVESEAVENNPKILAFLRQLVDYGDLYEFTHTTKNKTRERRLKWYLNPIYSPYFRIPETHPKEPEYVNDVGIVQRWIYEAEQAVAPLVPAPHHQETLRLID